MTKQQTTLLLSLIGLGLLLFGLGLFIYKKMEANLFVNPGFEKGTRGWLTYSAVDNKNFAAVKTGEAFYNSSKAFTAHSGNRGAKTWGKYDGNDNDINIYQEWLNRLTPGASYQVSGWIYHASQEALSGANRGHVFIKTFSNNTDWDSNFINEATSAQSLTSATTANRWRAFTACTTIEKSATFVQAGMHYKQFGDETGAMYVDDFELIEVDSCP